MIPILKQTDLANESIHKNLILPPNINEFNNTPKENIDSEPIKAPKEKQEKNLKKNL
ncbi:MAG: hypothetical protein ACK4UJ_01740 [Leptonema sp. (in: bacteria)]